MITFLIRRLIPSLMTMFVMSLILFLGLYTIGDPVEILVDPSADDATREAVRQSLGLDLPLYLQFFRFLGNALHGDLGNSFVQNVPAIQLILQRMPATLEVAVLALAMAVIVGLPLGMLAGLRPNGKASRVIMSVSILGFSLPGFWIGLMLALGFGVLLGWLPAGGRGETSLLLGVPVSFLTLDGLRHLILPAVTLSLYKTALIIRLSRAGTREVMQHDYIKFARAKGVKSSRIIFVHVLKNIAIPIVTVVGLEFGSLIAFAVVTETVFAWPGMGKLLIDSILRLDRPVVVAYLLIVVVMFSLINLAVDLVYSLLDPRIRMGGKA
ncbi:ABC transporter permease [Herbaspirillum lusitanum]|uniref:ABC transporter permease n=1 Tax=Herbaspirillum lusitanum TaxID=213312 RepID=A0ABW9A564_9BURK